MSTGDPGRTPVGRAALAGLLAALVVAVFRPANGFEFLRFDDPIYVTSNPLVQGGLSWSSIADSFRPRDGNLVPLTWISLAADASLRGTAAGGFHETNVLLHALASALLFLFLRSATGATGRSWVVAALFALHPQRAESVAWISERKDVLSAVFAFATMAAWTRWTRSRGSVDRVAAATLLAAGLLAKPMLVTVPVVLLLLDFWPLGRLDPRRPLGPPLGERLREKLPLFALSIAAGVAAIVAQRARGATRASELIPLGERVANALHSAAWYVAKTAWPSGLSFFYPFETIPAATALACGAALAVATALAVASRDRRPWLAVGWLWYLAMLSPVAGVLQVGEQARADRYTYLPSVGLLIAATWLAHDLLRSTVAGRRLAVVAAVAAVSAGAVSVRAEIEHWRNDRSLYARALQRDPGNHKAHYLLGLVDRDAGRDAEAIAHFESALRSRPGWAEPRLSWANLLVRRGRAADALGVLADAAGRADATPQLLNTQGICLLALGRPSDAEPFLRRAVDADPDYANARFNLADALAARGDLPAAVGEWQAVVRIDPQDADARLRLGIALGELGRGGEATASLLEAVKLAPGSPEARYALATALHRGGDSQGARREIEQAIRLRPNWRRARGFREGLETGTFPAPESLGD